MHEEYFMSSWLQVVSHFLRDFNIWMEYEFGRRYQKNRSVLCYKKKLSVTRDSNLVYECNCSAFSCLGAYDNDGRNVKDSEVAVSNWCELSRDGTSQ